ncbi:NERD domain-containing protein [Candidatus Rariloculus sp.]|uniref:NERD domain-containing protein n=1 Tax=Candidatus Rariloculus sp. TaxID=3101265 RepID=UPI003D0EECA3
MAKLFPALDPAEIKNPGERTVARALVERLPNRVEVFHGFNWLSRTRAGTITEGECDFVLLDAEHGLLFVEVKGGSLLFDGRQWVRIVRGEERLLNKDPFAQAQRGMHDIIELVRAQFGRAGDKLPFTYGFAVAFPDCRYEGTLPPSIERELILDASRLREVNASIRRIFRSFSRADHRALTDRGVESVRAALYPKYQLVPVIWRKIEDQEERLQRLTDDQQRILDILANQSRAAIRGVAGSGKTILALAKAQAIAREGARTLFLCYNRPLKDWLRDAVPESFGDDLVIENYHGLTDALCKQAGVPLWEMGDTNTREFWNDLAPEALMQACDRLGPEHKFDAVVVDEGQDFHELWWASLEWVFRDPDDKACYYVFFDPNQNLYVEDPCLPEEFGQPYMLPENCRNTVRIAAHCASLLGDESRSKDGAPMGDDPEIVHVRTMDDAFREAARRVRHLCMPNLGGLRMSQVAVLAPGFSRDEWPNQFGVIAATKSFDEWAENKGILIASWHQFKGLEADAIVNIETSFKDDARERINRYVARSRAKHLLTVITADEM